MGLRHPVTSLFMYSLGVEHIQMLHCVAAGVAVRVAVKSLYGYCLVNLVATHLKTMYCCFPYLMSNRRMGIKVFLIDV